VELDKMLGQKENAELLAEKLEADFREDPVRFFKTVVMPLLPKESKVDVGGGIVRWQRLLEAGPSPAPDRNRGADSQDALADTWIKLPRRVHDDRAAP
jgi:hypothetical protein